MPANLTILYPVESTIDLGYYIDTHIPWAVEKLKELGIREWKMIKYQHTAMGTPLPYQVGAQMTWDSLETLDTVFASKDWKEIIDDLPVFCSGQMPTVLVGEVLISS
ncbi:hypothetical protein BKA64DRAFT_682290 [Cadophora sp. MPI-SDFR-AT-0126]|nr:hypothetical protein BKA64DRAFT_682290 [Leotiomycetes sp. MPI-SDFR-AT-0126]